LADRPPFLTIRFGDSIIMPSLDRIITNLQEYLARECPGEEFEFITGDEGGIPWFRSLDFVEVSHVLRKDGEIAAMVMLARINRKRTAETRLQVGDVDSVEFFGKYPPDDGKPEAERIFAEAKLTAVAEGKLKPKHQPAELRAQP